MEYSIYINQKAAVAWELSMAESLMFAYLISSTGWMSSLPSDTRFKWASNGKLANELPLVCAHEGSVRRHMKSLEEKELIERRVVGNRGYFRITEKGMSWRSDTVVEPNEMVGQSSQPQPNGLPYPNEMVGVDPNEMVRQSDNQLSDNQEQSKSESTHQMAIRLYNEILPELRYCDPNRWKTRSARHKTFRARCSEEPGTAEEGFWINFFEEVRNNDGWMQRTTFSDGSKFIGCCFEWLMSPKRFYEVVDKCLDRERRGNS